MYRIEYTYRGKIKVKKNATLDDIIAIVNDIKQLESRGEEGKILEVRQMPTKH